MLDIHPTDAAGMLQNVGSRDRLQPEFAAVLHDCVEAVAHLGVPVQSVAVRGSIACGEAILTASDVDLVVVSTSPAPTAQLRDTVGSLAVAHPEVSEVDIAWVHPSRLQSVPATQFQVNVSTACFSLAGDDPNRLVPRFTPGCDLAQTLFPDLAAELRRLADVLRRGVHWPTYGYSQRDARFWTVWSMRTILRGLHNGILMKTHAVYTARLTSCALNIREALPSFGDVAQSALEVEREPSGNLQRAVELLTETAARLATT